MRVEGKPELLDYMKSGRLYDRIVTRHVGQVSLSRRIRVRVEISGAICPYG